MAFPSVKLTTLASLAHRLPAACWLVQRLEQAPERWGALPVWWVEGDLEMVALDLTTTQSSQGQWLPPLPSTALDGSAPHTDGVMLWIEGNLRLQGALTGGWPSPATTTEPDGPAVHALVMGDADVHCAILRGAQVHVQGNLSVRTLLWGDGGHGGLTVLGQCGAQAGLFTRGYATQWNKLPSLDFSLRDAEVVGGSALCPPTDHELLGLLVPPQYLNADSAGTDSLADMLNATALVEASRAQQPLTQPTAEVQALLPPLPALFADESISVAHIKTAVQSPLIAPKQFTAEGWFGQTDFSLCRQHVDADGDARQDSVFITVWKQWDFYLAVDAHEPAQGWLSSGWARLQRALKRPADHPFTALATHGTRGKPGLLALYRPYAQGEPGAWEPLALGDEEGANPAAQRACQQAWRGVLDYVRKGTAQARAHYPLWAQLQREITPARVAALTSQPLFAEHYNDWWDSEKNGLWAGQLWMGARQPCLHQGEPWGRAFKLSWKNGADGPGDAPDNAHSAYQIDVEEAREGPPLLHMLYSQRQSEPRAPLPPCASDHIARLLRLFRQAQTHIARLSVDMASASQPAPAPAAQLLTAPPFASDLPDTAVFGAEWMQRSRRWQDLGLAFVSEARAQLAATPSAAEESGSGPSTGASPTLFGPATGALPLPPDPRAAEADAVLRLAREVHRHAHADLSARFRRCFAFAPEAFAAHAFAARLRPGPVLLLDDGRAVVRIAPGGANTSVWWMLNGLQAVALPGLHGAGRSPNRSCFAQYDGRQITTHAGWDGPAIAQFTPPQSSDSALPAALACEELLPFNDGLRVLWRDTTGVYLLTPRTAHRLHPPAASNGDTAAPMLHMALTPNERFIAVGDQASPHSLLTTGGEVLAQWAPLSAYAHHATFSHEGGRLLVHACHLYTGRTGVVTLPSGTAAHAQPASSWGPVPAPVALRATWRVDASTTLPGMVIEGDAEGSLHALNDEGHLLWHHHIGGAVSAIDTSADGTTLVVASQSGYVVWLQQHGGMDPYSISTSAYTETGRWIFWQGESGPLHW